MANTYGKSGSGNYAVTRRQEATQGVWDAVEAVGELYRIINFDSIPECDWDRIDNLEQQIEEEGKR